MADASFAKRTPLGSPSLVDPMRARSAKDEALRTRFGLSPDEHLVKEFPCIHLAPVALAGTLYVFSAHLCFGARFFDGDVRCAIGMRGTHVEALDQHVIVVRPAANAVDALQFDVGVGQRDVLLGMLRMFTAQAGEATPAVCKPVGLWHALDDGAQPYAPLEDASGEERALAMQEADWQRVYSVCARSMTLRKGELVLHQGGTDAASTSRCYGISKGGVSLERRYVSLECGAPRALTRPASVPRTALCDTPRCRPTRRSTKWRWCCRAPRRRPSTPWRSRTRCSTTSTCRPRRRWTAPTTRCLRRACCAFWPAGCATRWTTAGAFVHTTRAIFVK